MDIKFRIEAPVKTRVFLSQRITYHEADKQLIIESKSLSPDAPMGERFEVLGRWYIEPSGNGGTLQKTFFHSQNFKKTRFKHCSVTFYDDFVDFRFIFHLGNLILMISFCFVFSENIDVKWSEFCGHGTVPRHRTRTNHVELQCPCWCNRRSVETDCKR